MKKIGLTFPLELLESGLAGLPFVWREDGSFEFTTEPNGMGTMPMTQEQVDAVLAVYDAHDPEAEVPEPVPAVVSRFQGRAAMMQTPHGESSLFDAVEVLMQNPAVDAIYRLAWADLQEFHRDSDMLAAIAGQLGLTSGDIDNLFRLAVTIKA